MWHPCRCKNGIPRISSSLSCPTINVSWMFWSRTRPASSMIPQKGMHDPSARVPWPPSYGASLLLMATPRVSKNWRLRMLVVQPESSRKWADLPAMCPGRKKLLPWSCTRTCCGCTSLVAGPEIGELWLPGTSCEGYNGTPCGARFTSLTVSVVHRLSTPSRGDTEKPGGEWRTLPTCRGGDRSLTWLGGAQRGGRYLVFPWEFTGGPQEAEASAGRRSLTPVGVKDSSSGSVQAFCISSRKVAPYLMIVPAAH